MEESRRAIIARIEHEKRQKILSLISEYELSTHEVILTNYIPCNGRMRECSESTPSQDGKCEKGSNQACKKDRETNLLIADSQEI